MRVHANNGVSIGNTTSPGAGFLSVTGGITTAGTLAVTGASTLTGTVIAGATVRLKGYTVATLPASPVAGDTAYVTDALAPTFMAIIAGGGAIVTKVFYNGTNWTAQ